MLEILSCIILLGGLVILFSGSPYFGLFGVLLQSIGFSLYFFLCGLPFFGLLVILVYVGGMLVVFLFSTILSAERYPGSSWNEFLIFSFLIIAVIVPTLSEFFCSSDSISLLSLSSEIGYSEVFISMGALTCLLAFILLVALVVILVVGFEHSQCSLRSL
uniref:NADH-ubiquinone oxidoreductase chain 6 n=1 Tax=Ophiuroglypha kinbergi TaxID=3253740 RepID=A0A7G9M4U3_9ECHI|nr:NADH dehydrogenase subunit 6 [Ophiura kinbergi]QNN00530.1 NADH dehydrogenase subunit 6 [Ophiura kinbergi]